MLVSIALVLCGGLASVAALLPQLLSEGATVPPPEPPELPRATASAAALPQKAKDSSRFLPAKQAVSSGTSVSSGTAAAARAWAEKMFTAGRSKDFGPVPFGTQLSHRFEITNLHETAVEITGLRLSCGCVQAAAGKRVLQPGEKTTIDVSFDTRQFTGPSTQTIRVGFGPNPRTACLLKVSAVSQTDVVFKPGWVSLGTVPHGQTAAQSIDVEYRGARDWRIEEVIVAEDLPFEATLSAPVRQSGKVGYRLTVALKENAPPGKIRDYLYLKTNQADVPPVPVPVAATVQP